MIGPLGMGGMRFPLLSDDPADIDVEQVSRMFDEFLAAGFTYFDTSYVYHNGHSEDTIKQCLTSRHKREEYFLASKLPTFAITEEAQVEEIFHQQLESCGVDYFDNYLLHNLNWIRYNREVKTCHMFDHLKAWKAAGKIRHIGFSWHDDAASLDRILTEQPEVEFVQIALNYIDWKGYLVQAKDCYHVIRKHGCKVVVMEPVKGGMLAKVPPEAEALMKKVHPGLSPASWAIRFAASLPGVEAVLSGMSNLEQLRDNLSYMKDFQPLAEEEKDVLEKVYRIYEESGPVGTADYSVFEGIGQGVDLAAILQTYNNCQLQPVPTFGDEANYFSLAKAKQGLAAKDRCLPEKVVLPDGRDVTELAHKAEQFLTDTAFFPYEPMK